MKIVCLTVFIFFPHLKCLHWGSSVQSQIKDEITVHRRWTDKKEVRCLKVIVILQENAFECKFFFLFILKVSGFCLSCSGGEVGTWKYPYRKIVRVFNKKIHFISTLGKTFQLANTKVSVLYIFRIQASLHKSPHPVPSSDKVEWSELERETKNNG